MTTVHCVFCDRIERGGVLLANDHAAAFHDGFPLNPGHMLIVPRRHESDFLALKPEGQASIWALVQPVRRLIDVVDPRGGVRWVITGKARYWENW